MEELLTEVTMNVKIDAVADGKVVGSIVGGDAFKGTIRMHFDNADPFEPGQMFVLNMAQMKTIVAGSTKVAELVSTDDNSDLSGEESEIDKVGQYLFGSSHQPEVIDIGNGETASISQIVSAAHLNSGLSVAEWNDLPNMERDAKIDSMVKTLQESGEIAETYDPSGSDVAAAAGNPAQTAVE